MTYIAPDPKATRFGPDGRGNIVALPPREEPEPVGSELEWLGFLKELLAVVRDPAADKKIDAAIKARATIEEAKREQKKTADDRQAADADIAAKYAKHDSDRAANLSADAVETEKRRNDVALREQANDKRERELEAREKKLAADRAKVDRKLALLTAPE